MFCVGLTGTIGSGKSTVNQLFQALGVHTISADSVSKSLTLPGQPALEQIQHHFGDDIIHPDGHLNRARLREHIFKEPQARQWLEDLLHPLIRKAIENEIAQSTGPYVVIEIPLLLSREHYPYLNKVLLVLAESTTQIERIILRDGVSREQAIAIIDSQPHNQSRIKLADDLIHNQGSVEALSKRVTELHQNYLAEAKIVKKG